MTTDTDHATIRRAEQLLAATSVSGNNASQSRVAEIRLSMFNLLAIIADLELRIAAMERALQNPQIAGFDGAGTGNVHDDFRAAQGEGQ